MPLVPGYAKALGFGAMRLSELPREAAMTLLHRALDGGIRFVDTADVYAPSPEAAGHNERLVAEALQSWSGDRSSVVVATKGGLRREGKTWIPDGRARSLKKACEASLKALGVEAIDLYQLHALDPKVKSETSFRALEQLVREGKVARVGLCNVNLEDLERASELMPVASVQVALSPLDQTPLKNGVVSFCASRGIAVLAHSPLGGHRKRRALKRQEALAESATRLGASVYEVALAWLRSLPGEVIAIPGATRAESLESSLRSRDLVLGDVERERLHGAYPASRGRLSVTGSGGGEVVLFVGYPGAGKSTAAERWVSKGYVRVNRDVKGGSLAGLLPDLERSLESGARQVVLDNTYPKRASRFDVLEIASRHGVPVRCVWLETSLERAQVNAATRIVRRYGRLLGPSEMKTLSRTDPNAFPPEAQFRYRRELEPPREEEGFSVIERVPFVAEPTPEDRRGCAVFFDPKDEGLRARLARLETEGYRLLGVSYEPKRRESAYVLEGVEVAVCNHPPPASCWCRKPLPGLGVLFIEKYALDPARCLVVGDAASDKGFAERLGMRLVPTIEL